ncbi:MAG: pilus assembly protein TadG-related protein [Kiritimatiellae bacterium]|nr:pilus assembly protein TadG-related protein [Kiritimatiellia bacterium]
MILFKHKSVLKNKSGQAIIFILLAMTTLIFFLLFNVDLHQIVRRKNQAQNAGDAATLAAARWQGASINLIGELNLMHIMALAEQNQAAVHAITNMQKRLCFTGPMTALFASQIAAKNNHIYVDDEMTSLIREHAATVRNQYSTMFNGEMYYPEPWPGGWQDYANMLDQVAADGIAAGPDNASFYGDPQEGHPLFNKSFYEAVESQNWCWFYLNANSLLGNYNSYNDWPPLPEAIRDTYNDCEFFSLGLTPLAMEMQYLFDADALEKFFREAGFSDISYAMLSSTNVMESLENWFVYDSGIWGEWDLIQPDEGFPITGPVREQYNYAGADAVVRVNAEVERMTPGIGGDNQNDSVVWTAASKPFGYLEIDGDKTLPTAASNFVLPAFRDVRLIPVDAASGSNNSSADAEWVRHIRDHVYTYVETGPGQSSCRYCKNLLIWESAVFRQTGIDWLALYCDTCQRSSGGGGRGGGSRRGH